MTFVFIRLAILGAGFINVVMTASVAFLTARFCRRPLMMISTAGVSVFLIILAICIYYIVNFSFFLLVNKEFLNVTNALFSILIDTGYGCMDFLLLYCCLVDLRRLFRYRRWAFTLFPTIRYLFNVHKLTRHKSMS